MRQPREYIGSTSSPTFLTAEELLHLNLPNKGTELVRGVLVVKESDGYQHGDVAMRWGAARFSRARFGRYCAAKRTRRYRQARPELGSSKRRGAIPRHRQAIPRELSGALLCLTTWDASR
jgi:hypothetical protein